MPPARWPSVWFGVLLLAALAVTTWELALRTGGESPLLVDDEDLWAMQLDRALAHPEGIAILGASRTVYGIDAELVEQRTGMPAAMLAVAGHYPLAALRHLALQSEFRGLVIVGIDARGLLKDYRNMQERFVEHHRIRWSPARRIHRTILSVLQPHLLLLRPEYSLVNLVKRWAGGHPLPRDEYRITRTADRSSRIHFDEMETERIRARNVANFARLYQASRIPSPDEFVADLAELPRWVRRIESRGGRVVFFRDPVAGEHLALDESNLPRERYWNRVAEAYGLTMLDFRDSARFAGFTLPDNSHISADQVPAMTSALVDELRARDLLHGTVSRR